METATVLPLQPPAAPKKEARNDPRTISLKQLAQKTYSLVPNLSADFTDSFGKIEDAFDMILFGASGNGKSNATAKILKELIKALQCKVDYVAYEEGHGQTIQETLIQRHNMLEELGNVMNVTEHLTYEQLLKRMSRRRSSKIWVIDSIQASLLTQAQCAELKRKFVLSKKRKIIIYISWSEGKTPKGGCAKAVEYYANIKVEIKDFIAFIRSRYGGNKNYVIWEEGAVRRLGRKKFNQLKKR